MIFTTAKGAFLEFLRNLTPQVLLLSIALVYATNLDLNRFDFSNFKGTLPFILVMAVFLSAAVANMLNFVENSIVSLDGVDEKSKALHGEGIKGWKHIKALFTHLCGKGKLFIAEVLITILIVQVGFLVVTITSIQSATNLYLMINKQL